MERNFGEHDPFGHVDATGEYTPAEEPQKKEIGNRDELIHEMDRRVQELEPRAAQGDAEALREIKRIRENRDNLRQTN